MHTINLLEFTDYECKDIYTYLMTINETAFRITMPRQIAEQDEDIEIDIATEYYDALYFGEKLSELSDDFTYTVPSAYSSTPFAYEFTTTDMEKLADTLFYLIKGIEYDYGTTDMSEKYWYDREKFWAGYCQDEIEPVCYGLLRRMENNL